MGGAAAAGALLGLAACAPPEPPSGPAASTAAAPVETLVLTIQNESGYPISGIDMAPGGSGDWGQVLGGGVVLEVGEAMGVAVPVSQHCVFDVRTRAGGREFTHPGIDVCAMELMTILP